MDKNSKSIFRLNIQIIDPSFQGVNILFTLSCENNSHRTRHTTYRSPTVETRTCGNITKIRTGQGHDYTTPCILDYQYFLKYTTWQQQI